MEEFFYPISTPSRWDKIKAASTLLVPLILAFGGLALAIHLLWTPPGPAVEDIIYIQTADLPVGDQMRIGDNPRRIWFPPGSYLLFRDQGGHFHIEREGPPVKDPA